MGINASRDQDYGWRLAPEWVQRVRDFKSNRTAMSILTQKNDGRKPTTTQILYYMYGEELAEYYESMEENENPYEEQYLAAINAGVSPREAAEKAGLPQALADFQSLEEDDDIADLIDDTISEDDDDEPTPPAPQEPAAPTAPADKPAETPKTETKSAPKADGKSTPKKS